MTETAISFESLLKVRKGAVEFVDVPEFGLAVASRCDIPHSATPERVLVHLIQEYARHLGRLVVVAGLANGLTRE